MTELKTVATSNDVFGSFNQWFADILDRTSPDLVIAIARGAVRLLQLRGTIGAHANVEMYSHYAMPFLEDAALRGKRVLVFDDSVIYGSTMNRVSEHLIKRGAIVTHAAYVTDGTYFGEHAEKRSRFSSLAPQRWKSLMREDVPRHHAALVHATFHNGLDFNLDFPLITVRLASLDPSEIPYLAALLRETFLFREFHNVTYPAAHSSNVQRWTALHDWTPAPLCNEGFNFLPNSKTRVTFVPERCEIHLKPIVQYAIKAGATKQMIQFADPVINALWKSVELRLNGNSLPREAPLLRLLTFFGATLLGKAVLSDVRTALVNDVEIREAKFDFEESRLVLGTQNADAMSHVWEAIHNACTASTTSNFPDVSPFPVSGSKLGVKLLDQLRVHPEWCPDDSDQPIESLGKLFLCIRGATDSDDARSEPEPFGSGRLDVGMNAEGIRRYFLTEFKLDLSPRAISLGLDYCVDRGLAVAKVIQEDGWFLRAFYSGEDSHNQESFQIPQILRQFVKETATGKREAMITPFDMQKICVTVKHLLEFVPLEIGPHNYGMTCSVNSPEGHDDLIKTLTKGKNPAFVQITQNAQRHLKLNPDYKAVTQSTWTSEQEQEFFLAFKHIRELFSSLPNGAKEAVLLLSTCGTAERAFQAIAFEMHAWCGNLMLDDAPRFGDAVKVAREGIVNSAPVSPNLVKMIYWSVIRIGEARKKFRIWESDYAKLKATVFQILEKRPELKRWWKAVRADQLFDRSMDPTYAAAFDTLQILLNQAETLTLYFVRLILACGAIRKKQLETEWALHHLQRRSEIQKDFKRFLDVGLTPATVARRYNLERSRVSGHHSVELDCMLCEQSPPAPMKANIDWYENAMQNAEACFDELGQILVTYFEKEVTSNYRYRFPVESHRAVTNEGRKRIPKDGVFILLLRFVGLEDAEEGNRIWRKLVEHAQSLQTKGTIVDEMTCAGEPLKLCCGYFEPLKSIIELWWEISVSVRDTCRMTTVVTFGSVNVFTTTGLPTLIRDQIGHNSIHNAKEVAAKLEQSEQFSPEDRVIAMTNEAWRRVTRSELGLVRLRELSHVDEDGNRHVWSPPIHAIQFKHALVFFCFNSTDRVIVETIMDQVEDLGIPVIIDSSDVHAGDDWIKRIPELLNRSNLVVVFCGPAGLGEIQTQEIAEAKKLRKRMKPCLLPGGPEPGDIPFPLCGTTAIDIRSSGEQSAINRIRDEILADVTEAAKTTEMH